MDTTKEKTIGGTDANGFAINTPISTTQLQPVQPLNIPTQTPDFSPFISAINNAGSYTNTALLNTQAQIDAQAQMDAQNKGSALSNLMAQTQAQIGNKGADTAQAYQTGGVNDLAKQLRTLNAQAQGLNLEAQAIPIQIQQQAQGQGVTDRGVAPIQAARLRENALKALSIAQQSAVAQADYATAKDLADQQIAIKYDALENDLKVKQLQLNALDKYVLTPAQEKAKESRVRAYEAEQALIKQQRETETAISDVGMTLRKYGASDSIVKDVLQNSRSLNDAIIRAGANLQDPRAKIELENLRLENVLKNAQILKAQREASLVGQLTPAQQKEQIKAMKETKSAIPVMQDKITVLNSILESPAISSTVGTSFLSRAGGDFGGIAGRFIAGATAGGAAGLPFGGVGAIPGAVIGGTALASQGLVDKFTGERQKLIGSVNQLVSKEFLQAVLNLKAQGGTLGQLTEREGNKLQQAATKIGTWEVRNDKDEVIGYNVSEKDFKEEIQKIKDSTSAILKEMQGDAFTPEERAVLDAIYDGQEVNPSDYFGQ